MALKKLARFDEAAADALEAMENDPSVWNRKVVMLVKQGYLHDELPAAASTEDLERAIGESVRDAVLACVHDEQCG